MFLVLSEKRTYMLRYVPCVVWVKNLDVTLCSLCCLSKELICYLLFLVLTESRSYILRYVPCVDRVKTLYVMLWYDPCVVRVKNLCDTFCSLCCLSKELKCYVLFPVLSDERIFMLRYVPCVVWVKNLYVMRYGCSFDRCSKLLLRGGSVGCFSLVWLCHSFCLYVCLLARKVCEPRAGAASQCDGWRMWDWLTGYDYIYIYISICMRRRVYTFQFFQIYVSIRIYIYICLYLHLKFFFKYI